MTSSAAYSLMVENILVGKSFMQNKKSKGPKTEPWGTPEITYWKHHLG